MSAEFKESNGFQYWFHKGDDPSGLCIYILGLPQDPAEIEKSHGKYSCSIVYIVINAWDDDLTPWSAPNSTAGSPDFKGLAPETLKTLTTKIIPDVEKREGISPAQRDIAGYSLSGLFATYAFANSDVFHDMASMSGSFWYEGWIDYLSGLERDKKGTFAYLSLGLKECKVKQKLLQSVQENTDKVESILESWGTQVEKYYGPGGHFDFIEERVEAGLSALIDAFNDQK